MELCVVDEGVIPSKDQQWMVLSMESEGFWNLKGLHVEGSSSGFEGVNVSVPLRMEIQLIALSYFGEHYEGPK